MLLNEIWMDHFHNPGQENIPKKNVKIVKIQEQLGRMLLLLFRNYFNDS